MDVASKAQQGALTKFQCNRFVSIATAAKWPVLTITQLFLRSGNGYAMPTQIIQIPYYAYFKDKKVLTDNKMVLLSLLKHR
jgi:hypothetical protein